MKKPIDSGPGRSPRQRRSRGAVRGDTADLAPELLPVQVLRDLLVEAWVGAIADGGHPVVTRVARAPRSRGRRASVSGTSAPSGRRAPIRERILAEIERQRGTLATAPEATGRRRR